MDRKASEADFGERVDRMEKRQRLILKGPQHYFVFPEDHILNVIAETLLDHAILQVLRKAGPPGKLPKDVAIELAEYKLNPWNVTQRIRRMNKRLDRHIAKHVAEKRGLKWALTNWACYNWGSTKKK